MAMDVTDADICLSAPNVPPRAMIGASTRRDVIEVLRIRVRLRTMR